MTAGTLLLGSVAALAVVLYLAWIYRRREVPVARRGLLAALRIGAALLVLLLLLDPTVPVGAVGPAGGPWVLLDASTSMVVGGPDSTWRRARSLAQEAAGRDGRVVRFGGDDPAVLSSGEDVGSPTEPTSLLSPALERAAEAGAGRVLVVTDLRLGDPERAARAAERLGLEVQTRDVGVAVPNAGVDAFRLPEALSADAEVLAEVVVSGSEASSGDSATVEVREEDRLVASRRVTLPPPGRSLRLDLALPPPSADGELRYTATVVLEGDGWVSDDTRTAYADVDPEAGALVLVSTSPDWEPRFLLPVLGSVTGLRTRGFLRVGGDRWLTMDHEGAGEVAGTDEVARTAEAAELLVVQGEGADEPSWLAEAFRAAPRAVLLAQAPGDLGLVDLGASAPVAAEWYVVPDLPPSPLAGALAGVELDGLPPLGPLLPLRDSTGHAVPLRLQRGGTGPGEPGLILLSGPAGRRAVSLAPGYWRWAFRPPAGRDAYRRLWAGVAGWLLAETTASGPRLRPVRRVVSCGEPVEWVAGATGRDSVQLVLSRGDSVVVDTVLEVPESGRFRTPLAEPGNYRWTGRVGDEEVAGRVDVESWSRELSHPRAQGLEVGSPREGGERARGVGRRPLRTHPLPYLAVLALLCAEWIGRRRMGLR